MNMTTEDKIEEIASELRDLKQAQDEILSAIFHYQSIDWPTGIYPPHHVEMEMDEVHSQIEDRIQEIEDKLERI